MMVMARRNIMLISFMVGGAPATQDHFLLLVVAFLFSWWSPHGSLLFFGCPLEGRGPKCLSTTFHRFLPLASSLSETSAPPAARPSTLVLLTCHTVEAAAAKTAVVNPQLPQPRTGGNAGQIRNYVRNNLRQIRTNANKMGR